MSISTAPPLPVFKGTLGVSTPSKSKSHFDGENTQGWVPVLNDWVITGSEHNWNAYLIFKDKVDECHD